MDNKRIYAKIMRYLERRVGSSKQWDFRTLRLSHPQLADVLHGILIAEGIVSADVEIQRHYVPRKIIRHPELPAFIGR
jgi:hypothetical protein